MAGLGLGLGASALKVGLPGGTSGGTVGGAPLRGWDRFFNAGTSADVVLSPGDDIQAAVDAAHGTGQPRTIALRGGTYRQSVVFPSGATGLTLKRYGTERPVITGAEPLTGWVQCTVTDEPTLGPDYASAFRTTIPAATTAHDTARLLNLHHAGTARYIAQDVAGYTDPVTGQVEPGDRAYIEFDNQFHETGVTYAYDGSDVITAITSQAVFGAYTQAQLESDGVILSVYCSSNRVAFATITSYDPGTFTAQVSSASGSFVRSTTGREAFGIVNLPAALRDGDWAALRDGSDFVVYYRPLAGEAAGLDATMEYSARSLGIDLGGCTDLTLRGLDLVQFESITGQQGTCITSGTSGRRQETKTGLTIEHCRAAGTFGGDYGAIHISGCNDLVMSRVTVDEVGGFGMFLRDASNLRVSGIHARRCGFAGLRVYTIDKGLFADMLFEENGRGGHSNQLNFYEGCDEIAVAFLETRGCFGYVTHQEASNITYYMSSIMVNRDDGSSGRGIADQNRGANAGQGGPDGSGAPVAGSDFRYICLDLLPYDFSDANALSVGGGDGTAERSIILNNLLHGGGNSDVYTDGDPAALEVRDGNVYTGLSFWQSAGWGWSLAANESVADTGIFVDLAARDLRHRGDSPLRGAVGVDMTAHVEALEALWPDVDFRRDLNGNPVDPATPPVGALADRGDIPVTSPGTMDAPSLGSVTDDGLTVTLAAAPAENGAAIASYDLRYTLDGGSWTEVTDVGPDTVLTGLGAGIDVVVQSRAVNAIGAGAWSSDATASTISNGLPDGIISDPEFLNAAKWRGAAGITFGAGLDVDGSANQYITVRTERTDLFAITGGASYSLSFDISRLVANGGRVRLVISYYIGSNATDGVASVSNSGNIGGSTITLGATGEYGPYMLPVQPPADATHAEATITLMNANMDFTMRKISLVQL